MKICWGNLDGMCLTRGGTFRRGSVTYVYRRACIKCGESYLAVKYKQSNFCGISCAHKGKKASLETRKKMSKAQKGKKISDEQRKKSSEAMKGLLVGEKNGFYGKTHPEETKRGISDKMKGKKNALGTKYKSSNNVNWKGGVRKKNLPLYDTYCCQIDYVHEVRSVVKDDLKLLEVRCKNCNSWFVPKATNVRKRVRSLLGKGGGENNFYCSDECRNSCSIFKQVKWPKDCKPYEVYKSDQFTSNELKIWRKEVLRRADYRCEYCDREATDAHHIIPKKLEPFFALDPDYGIACCGDCHYKYGHRDSECNTSNLAHINCNDRED